MAKNGKLVLPAPKDLLEFATLMVAPAKDVPAVEPAPSAAPEIVLRSVTIMLIRSHAALKVGPASLDCPTPGALSELCL